MALSICRLECPPWKCTVCTVAHRLPSYRSSALSLERPAACRADLHSSRDAPDPSAAAAAMPRDVAAGGPSDSIPPPRTGPIAPIGEIEAMGAPGPSTQAGAAEPAGDRRGTGEDAAAEPVRDRGGVREDDRKDAADRSAASDVGPSRPAEVETGETAVAGAAPEDPAMPGTTATTTEAKGSATYTLRITTGSGTGAGTDADVFVLLTGE